LLSYKFCKYVGKQPREKGEKFFFFFFLPWGEGRGVKKKMVRGGGGG